MNSNELRSNIKNNKIIVAMRKIYGEHLVKATELMVKHDIRMVELTFDQLDDDCMEKTFENIKHLKEVFKDQITIGAGTVMNVDQVQIAKEAGAEYLLAPNTNIDVMNKAHELSLPIIPGAMTPSEIAYAWEHGAALVKLFPAGSRGVEYCKSLASPLNNIPILPMGGVNYKNASDYLKIDNVIGVGVSNALVNKNLVEKNEWNLIESNIISFEEVLKMYKD